MFKSRKTLFISMAALAMISISACGSKEVSFDTLEQAKVTANENSLWNAQAFRQTNVIYTGWSIIQNGDSTQTPSCPQGDGWATMMFVSQDKSSKVKVKCSTVSAATSCMDDSAFKEKSYASEDGHCQLTSKVPFPLPKIAK